MWKEWSIMTGFEVTYEVIDKTKYEGWPAMTHMFGTTQYNKFFETYEFDFEQEYIWTHYGPNTGSGYTDLVGFCLMPQHRIVGV